MKTSPDDFQLYLDQEKSDKLEANDSESRNVYTNIMKFMPL